LIVALFVLHRDKDASGGVSLVTATLPDLLSRYGQEPSSNQLAASQLAQDQLQKLTDPEFGLLNYLPGELGKRHFTANADFQHSHLFASL
jgi:hypothetical protein